MKHVPTKVLQPLPITINNPCHKIPLPVTHHLMSPLPLLSMVVMIDTSHVRQVSLQYLIFYSIFSASS